SRHEPARSTLSCVIAGLDSAIHHLRNKHLAKGMDARVKPGHDNLAVATPMSTSAEPLVTVEDVHTYYGKSHILHGVSLTVGRGEVVGLMGRNGVGKSTTLKTIMGLVHPEQGNVLLEGHPIAGLPAHKLARLGIGYVPEDRRIFRLLTVMENL